MLEQEVSGLMANPTKGGVSEETPAAGEEGSVLEQLTHQFAESLKKADPAKVKKGEAQVKEFLEGDLKWAELLTWPPEKLHETAKQGYQVYQSGQYHKAEAIFKGLTVLDPENFYYHQMLAACFQQQQKYPESVFEYSVALELKKDDIVSFTNRGEVYFNLKLFELAERDFDAAIRLDPDNKDRWAKRSRLLKKKVRGILEAQGRKPTGGGAGKLAGGPPQAASGRKGAK